MSASSDAGFGRRLRMERERRTITLASISDNTKISQSLLEGLERDDVSRWPSGIFRRSFIRAYAQAIGLDADVVAKEFLERFPDPADPPPPVELDAAIASTVRPRVHPILRPFQARSKGPHGTVLRLTIAAPAGGFTSGRILEEVKRRWAAAACDVGVVVAAVRGYGAWLLRRQCHHSGQHAGRVALRSGLGQTGRRRKSARITDRPGEKRASNLSSFSAPHLVSPSAASCASTTRHNHPSTDFHRASPMRSAVSRWLASVAARPRDVPRPQGMLTSA
jgi:transcriptional regulator with XRE-family HTH domain